LDSKWIKLNEQIAQNKSIISTDITVFTREGEFICNKNYVRRQNEGKNTKEKGRE
jgi:hypothetical protein